MSRDSKTMSTVSTATTTILLSPSSKILSSGPKDLLDNDDVAKVMEKKLRTKDFRIKHWSLDPTPSTNGYMGQYFNLRVTCSVNERVPEKFVFFAKAKPPSNSPQLDFAVRSDVVNKEIRAYEDLLPRMGAGNGMDWKVDSYLGKGDDILVLEDATLDGYAMPDKYVPFGYEEYVVLLRSLAQLHSRSFVFNEKLRLEQGKTIWDLYGDMLKESLFPHDDESGGNIMLSGLQGASSLVDLVEGLDDTSRYRIKNRIVKWGRHMPNLLEPSDKYSNVVCHRDVWANNFMLKRDASGRPEGCYLLDFQFLSYLPPAVDFMLSLYLNTRHSTRTEHFEAFMTIYYNYLKAELKSAGLDIDNHVCWEEFRESCESYRSLAIIYTTVNQQIMLMSQEAADKYFKHSPELLDKVLRGSGRAEFVGMLFKTIKEYRERLTENILDIHQWLSDDVL